METSHGVFVATLSVSPLYQEDVLSGQERSSRDTGPVILLKGELDFLLRSVRFCKHTSTKPDTRREDVDKKQLVCPSC